MDTKTNQASKPELPPLATTKQVADFMQCSERHVFNLPLDVVKLGKLRRYRRTDVLEYVASKIKTGKEAATL